MKKITVIFCAVVIMFGFSIGCKKTSPDSPSVVVPTPTACATSLFGYGTLTSTGAYVSAGAIYATLYNNPSARKVTSLTLNAAATGNVILAVYSDNGGTPGARVAVTALTAITSAGEQTVNLPYHVDLPAGDYWLVGMADTGMLSAVFTPGNSYYISSPVSSTDLLDPLSSNGTLESTTSAKVLINGNLSCQ